MAGVIYWDGVSEEALAAAGDPTAFAGGAFNGADVFGAGVSFLGGEGPDYSDNPWDVVVLAGRKMPGICSVKGEPQLKIDKPKKGGADSIRFVATGYLPGPIDLSCLIWTPRQWNIFQGIATLVWRKPNKKSKAGDLALPISHPVLTLWGISQVIIQGVSTGKPGPVPQSRIFDFRLLEYVGPSTADQTKPAKPAKPIAEIDPRIPSPVLNEAKKPSDNPPGPGG